MADLKCPKCRSTDVMSTMMGAMVFQKPVPDTFNNSTCHDCGYTALSSEFGAMMQHMRGTENWTDEMVVQWKEKMRKGEIKFIDDKGVTICNSRALGKIELY